MEIACPCHEVFDFTANHVVEWSLFVVGDKGLPHEPDDVGTEFRTTTHERGPGWWPRG